MDMLRYVCTVITTDMVRDTEICSWYGLRKSFDQRVKERFLDQYGHLECMDDKTEVKRMIVRGKAKEPKASEAKIYHTLPCQFSNKGKLSEVTVYSGLKG